MNRKVAEESFCREYRGSQTSGSEGVGERFESAAGATDENEKETERRIRE